MKRTPPRAVRKRPRPRRKISSPSGPSSRRDGPLQRARAVEAYLSEFQIMEKELVSTQPPFLTTLRRTAMDRFAELGFPTPAMENWKNTDVGPVARTAYSRSTTEAKGIDSQVLSPYFVGDFPRVVLVNGRFSASLSSLHELPVKVDVKSLSDALRQTPDRLMSYWDQTGHYDADAFVLLNTAFLEDGVLIHVPENQVVDQPLHLIHVAAPAEEDRIFHPRILITVGRNSEVTVIEHFVGSSERNYFTNVVTELVASENASLHHVKLQEESPQASHISATTVLQHAHSRLFTCSISVGGRLIRNDVKIRLDGEGCHCLMNGLVLARSRQHVDNHTFISHDKPHCSSHQLYKGIYDGKSHGVFNGRIHVTKEGQKTDADQTNKNLLLSKDALVNSNPQLEINADDVRCTHGSTTGQIDEEALFYLRTRGLERRVAQMLLIRGFAHEIIDGIPSEVLRHYVDGTLGTWLSDMTRRETA